MSISISPEEVMQLHYKTIIFSVIGHPIFRDTVIYNKFKIYKPGFVERKVNSLNDLSYTFYTVEDIFRKSAKDEVIDTNEESFYKEKLENDKLKLKNVFDDLLKVYGKEKVHYKFLSDTVICIEVKFNRILTKVDKLQIKNKIDENKYFIEYERKLMKIHLKNLFEINGKENT